MFCYLCFAISEFNQTSSRRYSLTTQNGKCDILDLLSKLKISERQRTLLIHAFTGCDKVSGFFGFGKQVQFIFGDINKSLRRLRFKKYHMMTKNKKGRTLRPEYPPPPHLKG